MPLATKTSGMFLQTQHAEDASTRDGILESKPAQMRIQDLGAAPETELLRPSSTFQPVRRGEQARTPPGTAHSKALLASVTRSHTHQLDSILYHAFVHCGLSLRRADFSTALTGGATPPAARGRTVTGPSLRHQLLGQ